MDTSALLPVLGYGSGWALLGIVVLMVFNGKLITVREADGMQRQIDAQAETLKVRDETIAGFTEGFATSNELIRAVLKVAEEKVPPP